MSRIDSLAFILGGSLVTAGSALYSTPLAFIVAGLLLMVSAFWSFGGRGR